MEDAALAPSLRVPGADVNGLLGKGEDPLSIAIAIAFASVVAAPFFGRWRANVWLKANMPAEEDRPLGG